jgi:hypothetical protein
VGAGISIIPYRQQFVKRKVVQKSKSLDARICALCHVDFWGGVWYTIIVKGRGSKPVHGVGLDLRVGIGIDPQKCTLPTPEKISEISEKPLDKPLKV